MSLQNEIGNKQTNRRKEEQNTSWNSFKIHLRDVDAKRQMNRKTTSFGVELDQGKQEEGFNEMCQGRKGRWGRIV